MTASPPPSPRSAWGRDRPPNLEAERITGRPYLSHSQLACLRACPREFAHEAWRWTRVKRKTDKDDALKLASSPPSAGSRSPTCPRPTSGSAAASCTTAACWSTAARR